MVKSLNSCLDVSLSSEDQNYTFTSLADERRQFPASAPLTSDLELANSFAELLSFETQPDQPRDRDVLSR